MTDFRKTWNSQKKTTLSQYTIPVQETGAFDSHSPEVIENLHEQEYDYK